MIPGCAREKTQEVRALNSGEEGVVMEKMSVFKVDASKVNQQSVIMLHRIPITAQLKNTIQPFSSVMVLNGNHPF